ncbi:Acyl-CoA N-acyltransferase [Penicillium canariense]|uniref:Acyl-CoA N-acyltransferase n=1 Tax=Penicillium canariense TaxID=189055 RepID=A0A9W9I2V6_9EURO|nr:Acyl-CoA N-acyltransferase [Penicillium canariense]KAJ5166905.1 Acyl-CoA N-acyltransferase [Penicillium canariense]
MAVEVVSLTEADIPGAIQVIQQAFADDPYFKWVFDARSFNTQRNYGSLAARCRWGINNAIFQVAKDTSAASPAILGVSCWLAPHPPTQPASWYSWYQSWVLSFQQLFNNIRYRGHGGLRTHRYWIWKERQQEAQAQIWDDPRGYYFCNIVAVSPEAQGKGVGRMLFEAVTKRADAEGVKCYLESSKSVPNVQIYERMGFEMRKEMECRDGEDACMLYCMVRNPKTE